MCIQLIRMYGSVSIYGQGRGQVTKYLVRGPEMAKNSVIFGPAPSYVVLPCACAATCETE